MSEWPMNPILWLDLASAFYGAEALSEAGIKNPSEYRDVPLEL